MSSQRLGIIYALLAYGIWGLFPIYWKLLDSVAALEILSHRVIWSTLLLLGVIFAYNYWQQLIKHTIRKTLTQQSTTTIRY